MRQIDADKLKETVKADIDRCYALRIDNVGPLYKFLEQIDEQPTITFTEANFTSDQLMLLKMAFKLADDVVEIQRKDNYDVDLCNALYHLKERLGIGDIV
jgi:hypothetical protein